jgi:hypothetical protein
MGGGISIGGLVAGGGVGRRGALDFAALGFGVCQDADAGSWGNGASVSACVSEKFNVEGVPAKSLLRDAKCSATMISPIRNATAPACRFLPALPDALGSIKSRTARSAYVGEEAWEMTTPWQTGGSANQVLTDAARRDC